MCKFMYTYGGATQHFAPATFADFNRGEKFATHSTSCKTGLSRILFLFYFYFSQWTTKLLLLLLHVASSILLSLPHAIDFYF